MNPGVLYAALAYIAWGLFPLYFRLLNGVPALQVVLHRTVWSLLFVLIVLAVLRRWAWLPAALRQPRLIAVSALSALLLSVNWITYVWAVNNQHVVDASLGYFINPLVYVVLGYAVLHERPRPVQWMAVALAASGVVWLALGTGQWPWIALLLAASFGFYGLLRKIAPLGSLEGLAMETMLLAPLAFAWLAVDWHAQSARLHADPSLIGWLALSGPLTALPLLLFAAGARRISLATLGLVQYIGPTLQFLLGVWLFGEPFSAWQGVGFGLIWLALAVYSIEGRVASRRARVPLAEPI
jgi:chloramphenicol-sensitive protein RarD